MKVSGRAAADRLKAALIAGRQAAADEAMAIHDLVVAYDIEIDDDLIDELLVTSVRGGGEGTPQVHEFVHLELCGLLGVSARHARSRIFEVLNLVYRHPILWAAVQGLGLEMHRAGMAATKCSDLSRADADLVGRQWFHQQEGLAWKAAADLVDRLVIEADPALAKKKQDQVAACREVVLWGHREGVIDVTARMDALDALYLDATVDQLADILRTDEANAAHTKQVLRAKALGILATPALALGLQQQALNPATTQPAVQHPLLEDPSQGPEPEDIHDAGPSVLRRPVLDPETGRVNRDPHQCIGHACGRITVPPAKLQPKSKVYIHVDDQDLSRLGGAAFIEKVGWISSLTLKNLLGGKNVTIQPVIDLNTIPSELQYRPSARMREAIQLVFPTEAFPYSHTPSRVLELDHTVAYRRSCRDPQTGVGLMGPLHHKVHHAKTLAAWHAQQRIPVEIVWRSPLRFQYTVTKDRTPAHA